MLKKAEDFLKALQLSDFNARHTWRAAGEGGKGWWKWWGWWRLMGVLNFPIYEEFRQINDSDNS